MGVSSINLFELNASVKLANHNQKSILNTCCGTIALDEHAFYANELFEYNEIEMFDLYVCVCDLSSLAMFTRVLSSKI